MTTPFDPEPGEGLPMWAREPSVRVGNDTSRYVAALKPRRALQAPQVDAPVVDVAAAWESKPTVVETGTPIHRSIATLIRAAPIVVLLVILGAPVAWFTLGEWNWAWAVVFMAGMGLIGIMGVTLLDLQWNSPSSTERHRIDKAYSLKKQELKQTHDLRRAIVEAYINHLEGDDD